MTPWTVAHQAPLSMGFPSQEYWSELPLPPPGDLPDPGIKSPDSLALTGGSFTTGSLGTPGRETYFLPNPHLYSWNVLSVPNSFKIISYTELVAHQAHLSMEFSRQEYWSGLPFPSPRDLPIPGIEPGSPALHADSLPSEPPRKADNVVS